MKRLTHTLLLAILIPTIFACRHPIETDPEQSPEITNLQIVPEAVCGSAMVMIIMRMNSRGLRLTSAFCFKRAVIFFVTTLVLFVFSVPTFAEYQQIDLTVYGMD